MDTRHQFSLPRTSLFALALTIAGAFAAHAGAQWTYTNLHPPGATASQANGVGLGASGVQQVGAATFTGAQSHAWLWSGSVASGVDIHPTGPAAVTAGVSLSVALGVSGNQQCGLIIEMNALGTHTTAALWTGTSTSWVDIGLPYTPSAPSSSAAAAILNGTAAGTVNFGNVNRAAQWNNGVFTTVSTVTPSTNILALDASSFVGFTRASVGDPITRAALWDRATSAYTSLHAAAFSTSVAKGVSNGQQVGSANFGSTTNAILWTGSANSYVNLNPLGAVGSVANGVSNGTQCGYASFGLGTPVTHAGIWNGAANTWVDLHGLLPANYRDSFATAIYKDADNTYVVGYAHNTSPARDEAVMWTRANCVPAGATPLTGNVTTCPSGTATFIFNATGTGPFTYSWKWSALFGPSPTTVVDGLNFNPLNSTFAFFASGSNTNRLVIRNFDPTFAQIGGPVKFLQCMVNGECGGSISSALNLNFVANCPCLADIVGLGGAPGADGLLTADDILAFIAAFFANQPLADVAGLGGSVGPDGQNTADDLVLFLSVFFQGCR